MYGHQFKDLSGQTFGRLRVILCTGLNKYGRAMWRCVCSCGNIAVVLGEVLRRGDAKSCGCFRREVSAQHGRASRKHGQARDGHETPEYRTWRTMIQRCTNPNDAGYRKYGGRGIRVCQRWRRSFQDFFADMGKRPPLHSIHRLSNNRGYYPANCVWANLWVQSHHKRSMKLTQAKVDSIRARYAAGGVKEIELAAEYGIAKSTVSQVITGKRWAAFPPKKPSASVTAPDRVTEKAG